MLWDMYRSACLDKTENVSTGSTKKPKKNSHEKKKKRKRELINFKSLRYRKSNCIPLWLILGENHSLGVITDNTGIDEPGEIQLLCTELRHGALYTEYNLVPPVLLVVIMSSSMLKFALAWRKMVYCPNGLAPRYGHSKKNQLRINLRAL